MWVLGLLITLSVIGVIVVLTLVIAQLYHKLSSINDEVDVNTSQNEVIHSRISTTLVNTESEQKAIKERVSNVETRTADAIDELTKYVDDKDLKNNNEHVEINSKIIGLDDKIGSLHDNLATVFQESQLPFDNLSNQIKDLKFDVSESNAKWAASFADIQSSEKTLSEALGSLDARQMALSNLVGPVIPRVASMGLELTTLSNQYSQLIIPQIQSIDSKYAAISAQIGPRLNSIESALGVTSRDLTTNIKPRLDVLSNQVYPMLTTTESKMKTIDVLSDRVDGYDENMITFRNAVEMLSNVGTQNLDDINQLNNVISTYANHFKTNNLSISDYTLKQDKDGSLHVGSGKEKDLVYMNSLSVNKSLDVRKGGQLTFASLENDDNNVVLGLTPTGLQIDGVQIQKGILDVDALKIGTLEIREDGGSLVVKDQDGTVKGKIG